MFFSLYPKALSGDRHMYIKLNIMLVAICIHVPSQQWCEQMLVEGYHPLQEYTLT